MLWKNLPGNCIYAVKGLFASKPVSGIVNEIMNEIMNEMENNMSGYSPRDILAYVVDEKLEADFLTAIMLHKQGWSIAEIADRQLWMVDGKCYLKSESYGLNLEISDEEIVAAVKAKLYVSVFIAKKEDDRQLHFFVHRYPVERKAEFDENIAEEVVQYMIFKSIIALRLDTPEKVKDYCLSNNSIQ